MRHFIFQGSKVVNCCSSLTARHVLLGRISLFSVEMSKMDYFDMEESA